MAVDKLQEALDLETAELVFTRDVEELNRALGKLKGEAGQDS
jgi:hypothetical protein